MKWAILNQFKIERDKFKLEEIVRELLKNRGLNTQKEIENFLQPLPPEKISFQDLSLEEKEIKKAVERIFQAIEKNESIIIYGDYDADGICATAILWENLYCLTKKKDKKVLPYIPERVSEGYGLNKETILKLKNQDPALGLVITVDHGVTAGEKIEFAKEQGIDVIVCDHHQLAKEKPRCSAFVHTDKVCAATIAWFLTKEILANLKIPDYQSLITNYLDLVSIATIADLEPLVGINRSFAKYGLEVLNQTKRCGLLAIIEEAGLKLGEIGTYEVGFIIAPRLNAMGRMEHALESLRLICTPKKEQAQELARKLGITNRERQMLTEETVKHAIENLKIKMQNEKLVFVAHESYNQGIIGLVAGKLVEEFYRPAIVLTVGEVYSKASARSINGFNIIEAIRTQSELLVEAGGHPMAAGFTIETAKIELLRERLLKLAQEEIKPELLERSLKVDLEIPLSIIDRYFWEEIKKMSPFGLGNPEPIFASEVVVEDFRSVGNGKHLHLTLSESDSQGQSFSAIAFNQGELANRLVKKEKVKIAFSLIGNKWNGEERIELKIKDIQF